VFPVASGDLGLRASQAGFVFALLAASIALGGMVGGFTLARVGPKGGAGLGLAVSCAGGVLAAVSEPLPPFLVGQVLLGGGSGMFFASGLYAAAELARDGRRGLAMGFFGIAFSAGLATAALLAAIGSMGDWRIAFWGSALLSGSAAVAVLAVRLPRRPARWTGSSAGWHRALGTPLAVGGVAAASQYGTISFLPTFAVTTWGITASAAAVALAVARLLSVPSKLVAGHRADRRGALRTAGEVGLLLGVAGLSWTAVPAVPAALPAAMVFAAGVAALGPVANLLAVDAFGGRGPVLGLFRSLQIGLGAVMSGLIGLGATVFGLRPTLIAAALLPLLLAVLARRTRTRAPEVTAA
jgi:MFS family permease